MEPDHSLWSTGSVPELPRKTFSQEKKILSLFKFYFLISV